MTGHAPSVKRCTRRNIQRGHINRLPIFSCTKFDERQQNSKPSKQPFKPGTPRMKRMQNMPHATQETLPIYMSYTRQETHVIYATCHARNTRNLYVIHQAIYATRCARNAHTPHARQETHAIMCDTPGKKRT